MGKIYTEWEKHAKTAEQRLGEEGEEKELDCTWNREATKSLNEKRNFKNVTSSTGNFRL
jgi:hypothetical protein